MGRSNKHWPSMFKRSDYQSSQHSTNSFLTGVRGDERTSRPPRPRWNPTPEQVQILEDIFNSGMMRPPREEIKKIRERLLEYGQVGNVNVFYWFQNRKARKKKQTQPKNMNPRKRKRKNSKNASSSSSSHHQDASSNEMVPNNIELPTNNGAGVVNLTNDSPNDTIFGDQNLAIETDFQLPTPPSSPLFSFPSHEFSNMTQQLPQNDIFMNCANGIPMNDQYDQGNIQDQEVAMNMMHHEEQQVQQDPLMSLGVTSNSFNDDDYALPPLPPIIIDAPVADPLSITQFQGVGEPDHFTAKCPVSLGVTSNSLNDDDIALPPLPPIIIDAPVADPFSITQFQGVGEMDHFTAKCTVSINRVIIEVDAGPFNIRQIFGDEAVLFDSSGHLVLTDDCGVTLDSLQHGGSYILV